MAEAFPYVHEWAAEGRREILEEERDRYKTERDELLADLFEDYDTRAHLRAAILGADDEQLDSRCNQKAGGLA